METKDPALTKNPIADSDVNEANIVHDTNNVDHTAEQKGTKTLQETVIGTKYTSDDIDHGDHTHEGIQHNEHNVMSTDSDIEDHTTVNKGTDTFQESLVGSVHVNAGDNEARQPDRRDQKGHPFDEGINEHSTSSDAPSSEEITDTNRYANIDNAQTRVLNPDEKD